MNIIFNNFTNERIIWKNCHIVGKNAIKAGNKFVKTQALHIFS